MANEDRTVTLRMAGDVRIVVPATPFSITTFVLLEQEDWFEPELEFMRRLAWPGMVALDIGANHGVFALAFARGGGRVDAFEPAAEVAARLTRSAEANGFRDLRVHTAAMGDHDGEVSLSDDLPELRRVASAGPGARVAMHTLDRWLAAEPRAIDVVKIDVEGAEPAVVAGGRDFFLTRSPLVMSEIRDGLVTRLEAMRALVELGYESYRLFPGPGILVPQRLDESELKRCRALNLFAAKRDRAADLSARGLLALPGDGADFAPRDGVAWAMAQPALARFAVLVDRLRSAPNRPGQRDHVAAMGAYTAMMDESQPAARRAAAAQAAIDAISRAVAGEETVPRMLTAVAIACAVDFRDMFSGAMDFLMNKLESGQVTLDEPFVVPLARYAAMAIDAGQLPSWLDAMVTEVAETRIQWAGCFGSESGEARIARIAARGYLSPMLERRRQLTDLWRNGKATIQPHPLLAESLNSALWASPEAARAWLPE